MQFCSLQDCKYKLTENRVFISDPLPRILTINLNWSESDVKPIDIMKILLTFPDNFNIKELFEERSFSGT